jgi:predicted GTPase
VFFSGAFVFPTNARDILINMFGIKTRLSIQETNSSRMLFWGGVWRDSASRSNPKFKKCTHAKVSESSRLFNQVKAVYKFVPILNEN